MAKRSRAPDTHATLEARGSTNRSRWRGRVPTWSTPAASGVTGRCCADACNAKVWIQNEINGIPGIMDAAVRRGLRIALNPAPMDGAVRRRGTGGMDLLFVNASEGAALTGCDAPDDIIAALRHAAPATRIVLTMGSQGAVYADGMVRIQQAADPVQAVDTTAAGDTFIGFFLAAQLRSMDVATALQLAGRAAALCVTRHGAADAIPVLAEVEGPDA